MAGGDENIFMDFNKIFLGRELDNYFQKELENVNSKYSGKSFASFVSETLNKFEAISINISSNAAGIEYIYPSLHQTIIPYVQFMSLNIGMYNKDYTNKDFIHVISVYNKLISIEEKESKAEEKRLFRIEKLEKKYDRKLQKLHNNYNKKSIRYTQKLKNKRNKALEKNPDKI